MIANNQNTRWKPSTYIILLIGLAFLVGMYEILRYSGLIGESDTASFTRAIANMLHSGTLTPSGSIYPNGYGYQVLVIWLMSFTGLPLGIIQVSGGALLLAWVVVPAWLAYREFTQSTLAASLAGLILLVQPDFLFPLLRGTHEKFTRGLMFLCFFLLLRGLRSHSLRQSISLIACFYLSAYALIAFNTFYSSSYILGIAMALGLVLISSRWLTNLQPTSNSIISKLFYVTISLLVIAFIFTFYAYTPAQSQLRVLQNVWERLSLLFLQVKDVANDPYQVVATGWVSLPVYYLVSAANWLLLGTSLILWLRQFHRWLIKKTDMPANHELILWAFYTAFAGLSFISILVDVSGALASNLQHRSFPTFAMVAAPVVGTWIASMKHSLNLHHKLRWAAICIVFACLMILSIFKATNEPMLSNYWLFYTPADFQTVSWAEQYLSGSALWVGKWNQISAGYFVRENGRQFNVSLDTDYPNPSTHNFLISDVIRLFDQRIGIQLPVTGNSLITYDNGTAQIYHDRPVTPFQK